MLKLTIRTCICCREKSTQSSLNRLQCIDKKLVKYSKIGRSFYICDTCLADKKRLEKALYRFCKNKDNYMVQLKEMFEYGR